MVGSDDAPRFGLGAGSRARSALQRDLREDETQETLIAPCRRALVCSADVARLRERLIAFFNRDLVEGDV